MGRMPPPSQNAGGDFEYELPPTGLHFMRLYQIIDLGMQAGYKGKPQHKVYWRFELPGLKTEWEKDGVQHEGVQSIGETLTYSLNKNTKTGQTSFLRRRLEGWRGVEFTEHEILEFDLMAVLGKTCMGNIVHERDKNNPNKVYANIDSLSRVPKDLPQYDMVNKQIAFSLYEYTEQEFIDLPEWAQQKVNRVDTPDSYVEAMVAEGKTVNQPMQEAHHNQMGNQQTQQGGTSAPVTTQQPVQQQPIDDFDDDIPF